MDTTVTAENKLWWPMSEALYATILAYETTKVKKLVFNSVDRLRMFSRKISTSNGAPRFGHILKLILLILKMVAIGGDIFVEMVLFLTNSKVEIIKAAFTYQGHFCSPFNLHAALLSLSLAKVKAGLKTGASIHESLI